MATCASSAVPFIVGINSVTGVRATNAALIHHVTGACALRAPPRHASRSKIAEVTARHLFSRNLVHPLVSLTMLWRSVRGVGRPTLKHILFTTRWRSF